MTKQREGGMKTRGLSFTLLCGLVFLLPAFSQAAVYYVNSQTGQDSNPGTSSETAWQSLAKANSALLPGDTVMVGPGVYEEAIQPSANGTAGNFITYAAQPNVQVVIRQVLLTNRDYIRVMGFEITHNGIGFTHAVQINGTTHCEILHNYIHHIYGQGIRNSNYYGNSDYNVIRGNTIMWTGCPTGVAGQAVGANGVNLLGTFNLIEYNDISHTLDFVDTTGGGNIIRNNYLHDFRNSDFPDGSGDSAHVDGWQPYPYAGSYNDRNIFEYNWLADNLEANSHFNQIRDESLLGEKDFIIRGNVGLRHGSYVAQFGAIDYVRLYNNTFADFSLASSPKQWSTVGFTQEPWPSGTDYSLNNHVFNNIFYRVTRTDTSNIIGIVAGNQAAASHNACEETGSDPSCAVTSGIRFADYGQDDLHLSSSSNCLNAGQAMTTVNSASGSGTVISVADAGFFTDGQGLIEGDVIKVGAGSPVAIASIDFAANSITVQAAISWNTGDPVVLGYQAATPAIGAFEYKSDYSYAVNLLYPAITSPGVIRLEAGIGNPDNVRWVEFYVDGLLLAKVTAYPFACTWNSGTTVKPYVLTARAYARFADTRPIKSSTLTYTYGVPQSVLPATVTLQKAFPQPAGDQVTFRFAASGPVKAEVKFFNVAGKFVSRLSGDLSPGQPDLVWKTQGLSSGLYFYVIYVNGQKTQSGKLAVK
ncbi:MAG: T9SS type A sorting domain-containing protein [candidate division FCPU426 bacterium]